ncbi:VC0807 family protein [Nocardia jejuensis]|uniref:VC0807 family protein n=1 Tax=Nocardia jejuensis TaxID=328049 RepID=UPI0008334BD7|nr:VC0807 family protein [Nocardia jejuensis]
MTSTPRNRSRILWLACDLGVSPATFFLAQAAGVGVVHALEIATVVAVIWVGVTAIRTRTLDALALTMVLTYAVMLAIAAATRDPRLLLLRDPTVSALAGLLFLASAPTRLPATAELARRLHGTPPTPEHIPSHRVQSLVWGTALTAESAARSALVFSMPIPVTAAVSPLLELAVIAILVAWTWRYRRRHPARVTPDADSAPVSSIRPGVPSR